MSFMDGCKPQGPLDVLTSEAQRVTDYYQRMDRRAEHGFSRSSTIDWESFNERVKDIIARTNSPQAAFILVEAMLHRLQREG
jgi:hypothetical protein